MSRKIVILGGSILTMVAIGILIYVIYLNKNKSDQYFTLEIDKVIHKVELLHHPDILQRERILKNKTLKYLFTINNIKDTVLFIPVDVKTDEMGNIYIQDTGIRTIKKFSPDGKLLKKFGGHGNGPGEFSILKQFYVKREDFIYALDTDKIVVFEKDNIQEYKLNNLNGFTKIFPQDINNVYVLTSTLFKAENSVFNYDLTTKKLVPFESLYVNNTPQKSGFGPIFDGFMFRFKDQTIYVPRFFNMLYYFKEKNVSNVTSTIDEISHPTPKIIKKGNYTSSPGIHLNEEVVNHSAFMIKDSLYILSLPARKKYADLVFDVYSIIDGKYCHSLRFDYKEKFLTIHLTENRLIVVDRDLKVNIYNY